VLVMDSVLLAQFLIRHGASPAFWRPVGGGVSPCQIICWDCHQWVPVCPADGSTVLIKQSELIAPRIGVGARSRRQYRCCWGGYAGHAEGSISAG